MNIDTELQDYDAAGSLAEELPYWGWLDDERSCLTRAGELMSLARISPFVLDGQTPEQLDRVVDRWQRMLSGLDARTRFYFYLLRRPVRFPEVPPNGASKVVTLGQRKRREFLTKRVQDVSAYVAWAYDPGLSTVASERAGPWWMAVAKNWMARRRNAQRSIYLHSSIEAASAAFRQTVDASRALVDDLTPLRLLKAHEASEVLSELTNRPGTPWDGATGSGMNWRLAVSELEAERRNLRLDGEPVVLYSLLSPPGSARSNLLADLYRLDATLTVTLEWRPQRLDSARRKIRGAQRHYFSKRYSMSAHVQETEGSAAAMVDTAAAAESDRLGDALVELETDGVAYGDLALTVAIHGPLAHTDSLDGDIRRIFASHDAKVIREGYGQLPAWFSRMPGQPRRRQVRSVFVSAGVAACMAPIFGPPVGTPQSAHLRAAALAVLETQWRTPYHYDLFAGDVGHTLVLGATGAGKSFALNFLLVQALQYDPRILILDLGGSYRWLTQFLGGGYMELSPAAADGEGFQLRPFSLPAGERTYQFLTGWISRLLRIGGWNLSGSDPSEIRARVEDLYAFAPAERTLGTLVHSLPSKMWPALGRWHGDGAWGRYFDNPADGDDLQFQDWQVIDMAGAAEHDDLCEAALFYLLERLRLALENPDETARVKLMVVDEAWRYLQDPAVLSYLAEAAKTWRKKNAALIVATQSAVDVTGTAGAEALLESMPTKLFLANGPDPAQSGPPGPAAPAPNSLGFPGASAQPARDYANPPRLEGGDDPPGWERIYEGAFLEAVLVTQLSGDFPGPVLAQVAVPFYSAGRQRVLVPRGARVIGTASAVQGQDQERLAVSFHRLIYPDGRWVTLDFHGLNQVGEGALKDQVNRHYFSMFAAVGAVGIISGLTLQNSNPYGGGAQAFRAGAGQGLGQAAEQILQRFLNRLPTLTIRAGHRFRIWLTSDVLVPRNLKGE